MCSKSLVFDPDDFGTNIIRLPFRDCASIVPRRASDGTDYFVVHTRCAVEIPPHASYIFHKLNLASPESEYVLSLAYESAAVCLAFVNQLHGLYRLPNSGAGPGTKAYALAELIRNREEGIAFEASSIVDIRERALLPNGAAILAQQVQPLLLSPGRFQLTDARIYFQNFNSQSTTRRYASLVERGDAAQLGSYSPRPRFCRRHSVVFCWLCRCEQRDLFESRHR